jgi:hypothetical protein
MRKNDAMNAEETLDYALGRLEGHRRDEFERRLASDTLLADRVEHLTQAVHHLLDDDSTHDPPEGLASRTIAFVTEAKTRKQTRPFHDQWGGRSPFRWADVAVAASIFFVGVLTIIPLLQYARDRRNQAACEFNLKQIGQNLSLYATSHSSYPYPSQDHADDPIGSFALVLNDEGLLPDPSVLDCPYNGPLTHRVTQLPKYENLRNIRQTDPERYQRLVGLSDYAYHAGYRHPTGQVGPLETRLSGAIPLIADKPGHDHSHAVKPGNSPNHAGLGQNVLFSDGGVKWRRSRFVSAQDPDIFLNNEKLPRPGTHVQDSVLLPGHIPFNGD